MEGRWQTNTSLPSPVIGHYSVRRQRQVELYPDRHPPELVELVTWAVKFLCTPSAELGRTGVVCPFTGPSIDRNLFFVIDTFKYPSNDTPGLIQAAKSWHLSLSAAIEENLRPYLTLLVPLPWITTESPLEIDRLQRSLKTGFVRDGLMVGQFHPASQEPGIWNDQFRPLRAPIPLLAIRFMVPGDIVFLRSTPEHLDAYLQRFAPAIPKRARLVISALANSN